MTDAQSATPPVTRTFALLASGESVARALGFAATVVLARTLGPGGFGVVAFAIAVRLYLIVLVESGIDSVGLREVATDKSFLSRAGAGLMVARILVAAGLVILVGVPALLILPEPDGAVLAAYALTLLAIAGNTRWALLGLGHPHRAAAGRVVGEALFLGLVVVLVREPGSLGLVPLLQFVGDAAAALVLGTLASKLIGPIRWREGLAAAAGPLRQAAPLTGHALLGLVMFNADIVLLRAFAGPLSVGIYAAAYTPISFCLNLGVTYYQSLLPALSRTAETAASAPLYQTAIRHVLLAGVPIAVAGAFLAGAGLDAVFGPEYRAGATALAILAASVPFSLLRNVGQAAIVARHRQDLMLRISLGGAIGNLALNLILIPRFGPTGAAIATLTTEIARTGLTLWFASSVTQFPRLVGGLAWPLVGGAAMAGFLAAVPSWSVWPASAGAVAVYILVAGFPQWRNRPRHQETR